MAREDRAEEEDDLDPTSGVENLSSVVLPEEWNGSEFDPVVAGPVPPRGHSRGAEEVRTGKTLIANPGLKPAPAKSGLLEPQTGKTLIANLKLEPAPAKSVLLEPQTGKTLIANSTPDPAPAGIGGLEPQTGKTLVANPRPEPAPAGIGGLEPQTGKTLIANPRPEPVPATTSREEPGTDRARIEDALPDPPESQRLAGRRVAPSTVPRSERSAWVGGYEVLARLHRSTRGTVYLCRPGDAPDVRYTMTVLRHRLPTWAERDAFLRYANRLAKRVHPSVLELIDAGVYYQQPYLVRRRCEGLTFDQLLAATPTGSRLPRLVLPIFEAALEALAVVHESRLIGAQPVHFVHGALTADELLITTTGCTLVTGVGEATILGSGANDPSEDLLALGILVNEALTGGREKALLQDRWLADARAGRSARAADLLGELRRVKARNRVHARTGEIADWVASVKRSHGGRNPAPAMRESSPSVAVEEATDWRRFEWLATVKSWWTRRRSG